MSWREITLGEAIRVKHGYAFKGEFFSPNGSHLVVTPGNFHESGGLRVREGKERFYVGDIPEDFVLAKDDLIVAMTEQGEGLLGSSAWIPEDDFFLHNQRIGLVSQCDESLLHKRYLYWLFNTPNIRSQIRASATGAKVKHTAPERLYKVRVSIPDIAEQQKITALLDNIAENQAVLQRQVSLLEEAARLIYVEWFVRLRFPGHEKAETQGPLPEGWYQEPLGQRIELNYGKSLKESDREPGEIPVFGSSGIVGHHANALSQGPGIIVGRKGNVGSIFYSPAPFFAIDTVYFISPEQTTFFLLHTLQRMNFISSDAAVPGLNRNYAYSQPITWPSDSVLSKFEATCTPIYEQITTLERQIKQHKSARDLLLPRLISGQLRL